MAITVQELYGDSGKAQVTGEREYTRRFIALVDRGTLPVNEVDISLATGCPRRYDPLGPQDTGAKCVDLSIKEDRNTSTIWRIKAKYTTKYGKESQKHQPNPLLRPAEWRYETVKSTRTKARDTQGNAYETTAGEPFQSPPEAPYGTSRWTITKNFATFDDTLAETYAYSCNSSSWKGKAANAVLCDGITADDQEENDVAFWIVTFVFLVDSRNLWQPVEVANKGHRYLDADGNEQESETLIWLNASGEKWTDADPEAEKYLDRYPFDTANFRNLLI